MIRFSAVTKDFGGPAPALSDVTFEVEKGEFVFLTGHSGSGKSTLLKIITKEYNPTTGEVEFDHSPLSQLRGSSVHHHRRRIGVVFQDYRLLPELNVWENIALPLEIAGKSKAEIEERVTDLLQLVQLVDHPYSFPSQLSGGESQRVGIARALATAPNVLLADEPTGNLDPETTLMIASLFNKIHELGTTILFATHDLSILSSLSHRRLHLEKGKIVEDTKAGTKPSKKSTKTEKPEKAPHVESHTESLEEPTPPAGETTPKVEKEKPKFSLGGLPKIKLPFGKKPAQSAESTPSVSSSSHQPDEPEIKVEDLS